MGIHSAAILDKKYLEMLKLLNIYLNHFPRHEKYALANRIRNIAYELYELIVETQKRYHKKTTLTSMDIKHEQLRMQIRLAHELGYFRYHDGKTQKQSQSKNINTENPELIPYLPHFNRNLFKSCQTAFTAIPQ